MFQSFPGFLHHFVLIKLATSSVRAEYHSGQQSLYIIKYIFTYLWDQLAVNYDIHLQGRRQTSPTGAKTSLTISTSASLILDTSRLWVLTPRRSTLVVSLQPIPSIRLFIGRVIDMPPGSHLCNWLHQRVYFGKELA